MPSKVNKEKQCFNVVVVNITGNELRMQMREVVRDGELRSYSLPRAEWHERGHQG